MPRRPSPLPPETLYPRRLAGRALARALDGYELTNIARRFNADDPTECIGINGEFFFGDSISRRWQPLAKVYLDSSSARVEIEDIYAVIRPNHLRDFEPETLGIHAGRINVTVDLSDIIEQDGDLLRSAPQRIPPPGAGPHRGLTVRTITRGTRCL